ncbi:MAG: alpha/beta hydrolase [Acidocella sp. 20-57-95]|nr:MAG: alpha/beta hydrolase [Acidocella sp. 20-57-95]OYV60541.1 MAG: alpha/beta hydrolase [Acidocella sp. 21-58-7]
MNEAFVSPPRATYGRPDWAVDGKDWPNRAHSRFIRVGKWRWHVQIAGQGPVLLLLHGTGAATHSWRDMLPLLAEHFTVVAPDLPGHGFTDQPEIEGMTLPGMARGIAALLQQLGLQPLIAAGHSAGAAILLQMCLDGLMAPRAVVSLNGALLPFASHGPGRSLFAPLAKLFATNPFVPMLFSWQAADSKVVERLLASTGSTISREGVGYYARLARRSGHAGAALKMMANWGLAEFSSKLSKIKTPLLLIVGSQDRSIPASEADRIQRLIACAKLLRMQGLGHLAHEEKPDETCDMIVTFARETGVFEP